MLRAAVAATAVTAATIGFNSAMPTPASAAVLADLSWAAQDPKLGTSPVRVGRADGTGWSANNADDARGYLSFGPYATDRPAGEAPGTCLAANWVMSIDNNTADANTVVTLDVVNATTQQVIGTQTVQRNQFNATLPAEQVFNIIFKESSVPAGHQLEMRVLWEDQAYIKLSSVVLQRLSPDHCTNTVEDAAAAAAAQQAAAMQAAMRAAPVSPLAPMHFSCALLGARCKDNVAEPSNFGLSPVVYNAVDYYYLHPDLGAMNSFDLTKHYAEHGIKELRQSSAAFDPEYYRSVHPDLAGMDGNALKKHFFEHGIREGRRPSLLFDFNVYRATHADLATKSNAELILHYVTHGVYEGRRASAEFQIAPGVWGRAPILRGQAGIDLGTGAGRQNLPAEFLPTSNVVAFSVNGQPAIGAITPNAGEVLVALDPAQGTTGPIYDQNWAVETMKARPTNAADMPFSGPFTDMG